ncbi:Protein ASP-7, partial [Aphelenchoides avenae]
MSDGIFQYASRLRLSDVSVLHLLGGVAASNPPSLAGHLIVGGKATAGMCDEKWVSVSDDESVLILNRVTIGTWWTAAAKGKSIRATVSIGTAYTLVNGLTRAEIVKAVGAEYDFQTDSYIVYCSTVSSLPDIVFDIGEKGGSHAISYRIPANIYTRKTHTTADKCLLMFDECSTYGDDECVAGNVWHLGSTFLRPYCHLMEKSGEKWT